MIYLPTVACVRACDHSAQQRRQKRLKSQAYRENLSLSENKKETGQSINLLPAPRGTRICYQILRLRKASEKPAQKSCVDQAGLGLADRRTVTTARSASPGQTSARSWGSPRAPLSSLPALPGTGLSGHDTATPARSPLPPLLSDPTSLVP